MKAPRFNARNRSKPLQEDPGFKRLVSTGSLCHYVEDSLMGSTRTRSLNHHVTDSAAAGTALATGHRTNNGWLSMLPPHKGMAVRAVGWLKEPRFNYAQNRSTKTRFRALGYALQLGACARTQRSG